MGVNFAPNQNTQNDLGQFRFWCQKVLPAVYDDSLSYYELLCKVVNHLNEVIKHVNTGTENVKNLYDAFIQLQEYVNVYFDNLDVQEEINNKLDNMVATGTFGELLAGILPFFTPEMFGARGDGVTDDADAIIAMFNGAKKLCPTVRLGENTVTDYSAVTFVFAKQYAIGKTVSVANCTGLKLHDASLIALPNFVGDAMFELGHNNRETVITNCTFNGNANASTCLRFIGYSVATMISNSVFTMFKKYGIHRGGDLSEKGHEIMIDNCKVNQVEWDDLNLLSNGTFAEGVGIYFGANSFDNNVTNTIVCYCKDYTVLSDGGSITFTNCHFYGGAVKVAFNHTFDACYFDTTTLYTKGHYVIMGCTFTQGADNPAIVFYDETETNWSYETSTMTGNRFAYENVIGTTVIDTSKAGSAWKYAAASANYFLNCKKVYFIGSLTNAPNTGGFLPRAVGSGYIVYGDLVICYGETSADGQIIFPDGAPELMSVVTVMLTPMEAGFTPYYSSVNNNSITIGGTNGKKVRWTVIGRIWSGE